MNYQSLKESPFSPGKPVSPDLFVARTEEITLLKRKLQQASFGHNENVFIIGERGMGKSSLGGFVKELAAKEYGFYGVHCHLGGIKEIPNFARAVFQEMVRSATDETVFTAMKGLFGRYIKGVSAFGIGIDFTDDRADLQGLADSFLPAILTIYDQIKERHKGILLILDDLNGITKHEQFAHYIKSFVDGLATSGKKVPILLILSGLPERRRDMIDVQPSVARIFDIVALKPLDHASGIKFFETAFRSKGIDCSESSDYLSGFSQGYPMLMHELGDSIFWRDVDRVISSKDFDDGFNDAVVRIGTKYLDPDILESIKSDKYKSILSAIVDSVEPWSTFSKAQLATRLSEPDLRVYGNFIAKLSKAGLIKSDGHSEYSFSTYLYDSYIRMRFGSTKKVKDADKS